MNVNYSLTLALDLSPVPHCLAQTIHRRLFYLGCPYPSARREDVQMGWLGAARWASLASASLSQTLCSPRLCPPASPSVLLFPCHCGFSKFPPQLSHCTHRRARAHTRACGFLCWFQYKLARDNFALMSSIGRNVSAFIEVSKANILVSGESGQRGSVGRGTDLVAKWHWWI